MYALLCGPLAIVAALTASGPVCVASQGMICILASMHLTRHSSCFGKLLDGHECRNQAMLTDCCSAYRAVCLHVLLSAQIRSKCALQK